MNWWGRRWRPRMWLWAACCFSLLGGFGYIAGDVVYHQYMRSLAYDKAGNASAATSAVRALSISLPPLLACCALMIMTVMPIAWAAFRRFQLMLLAVVTILGFLPTTALLARLYLYDPSITIDTVWFLIPIALPIVGTIVLLVLILCIGLAGGAVMLIS